MLRRKSKTVLGKTAMYLFLTVVLIFSLAPVLWALTCSLRENSEIMKYIMPLQYHTFVPDALTLEPYINIFTIRNFGQAVIRTIEICATTIIVGLFINSLAGYSLSKLQFRGKGFLFMFVVFTIMIPGEGITMPMYGIVHGMGLTNTIWALLLPAFANSIIIFMFKQSFDEIPDELLESAWMDGCTVMGVYRHIILPLSVPSMIFAGLTLFTGQWEAFLWPLLAGREDSLNMVQVALTQFQTEHYTLWNELYGACVITALVPLLLLVPFQNFFIQGIAHTGIKG